MKKFNILLLEDDIDFLESLTKLLNQEKYRVYQAQDIKSAITLLKEDIDFAIIDINLPDGDGLDFLTMFKKRFKKPAILLTTKKAVEDKVKGLSYGVDYYLSKPVNFDELFAIIKNLLNKYEIYDAEWILNEDELSVTTPLLEKIQLNLKEFMIMKHISLKDDKIISRNSIAEILNKKYVPLDRSLDMFVNRLKKKIDPKNNKDLLSSVRGQGYRFDKKISIKNN